MKQSNIIISVIVAASVLLAAISIGFYVRETRLRSRPADFEATAQSESKQVETAPEPHPEETRQNPRSLTPEQKTQLTKQIEDIKQRWAVMSEAERKEFRAKMADIFQAGRPEGSRKLVSSSPEASDKFAEEFMLIKTKWEDMSEEERQAFMEKMRQSSNAIRQGND